jgi:hypothetical protein
MEGPVAINIARRKFIAVLNGAAHVRSPRARSKASTPGASAF